MDFETPDLNNTYEQEDIWLTRILEMDEANPRFAEFAKQEKEKFADHHQQSLDRDNEVRKLSGYERSFKRLLALYGIDVEIKKESANVFSIELPGALPLDIDLPKGYAVKGGAARVLLYWSLGITHSVMEPRDIDIVSLQEDSPEYLDKELAQKYMPGDYKHGKGVEELEDDYFDTRDFSVNEVLFYDNKLYVSKQCVLDSVRGIIRFTEFEYNERGNSYGEKVNSKLLSKALRLLSEMEARGLHWSLAEEQLDVFEVRGIYPFFILLHLDRAYQQGEEIAQTFFEKLKERDLIPENPDEEYPEKPENLIEYLQRFLYEPFIGRYTPQAQLMREEDEVSNLLEEYAVEIEEWQNSAMGKQTRI